MLINKDTNKIIALEYIKKQRVFYRRPLANSNRSKSLETLDKIETLIKANDPKGISVLRLFDKETNSNYGGTNGLPKLALYNDIVIEAVITFKKQINIDTINHYIDLVKQKKRLRYLSTDVTTLMFSHAYSSMKSKGLNQSDIDEIGRTLDILLKDEKLQRYIEVSLS